MPSDRFVNRFKKENSTRDLIGHRDEFLVYGPSKGFTRKWIDIIEGSGMPDLESAIVVLTGEANRDLNDLGCCIYGREGRQRVEAVFLDNPDREAMKDAEAGILRFHLPGIFGRDFAKEAWTAYLAKVYLHELGHARHFHEHGSRGSETKQEQEAEKFAWGEMCRLFPEKTVLAAYAMFWMMAGECLLSTTLECNKYS